MAGKNLIVVRRTVVCSAMIFGFVCASAQAGDNALTPFATSNQSPLVQVYGLPALESARVLADGDSRWRFSLDNASHYVFKENATENVLLDGETTRVAIQYARGFGANGEWSVTLPLVSHQGGSLDSTIEQWHDVFGLPQGGRDEAPRNRLLYRYQRDGITELEIDSPGQGLGDIQLQAGWQWPDDPQQDRHLALRASLSLPSGDADQLLGSGAPGAALWLSASQAFTLFEQPAGVYGGGGMLWLGEADILPDQQRRSVSFGSAGLALDVSSTVTLKLQADFHTPFYDDSELVPLSDNALQLVIGGDWEMQPGHTLRFAVSEDLVVGASPDVVFHLEFQLNNRE